MPCCVTVRSTTSFRCRLQSAIPIDTCRYPSTRHRVSSWHSAHLSNHMRPRHFVKLFGRPSTTGGFWAVFLPNQESSPHMASYLGERSYSTPRFLRAYFPRRQCNHCSGGPAISAPMTRSEEHTSELQ